MSLAGKAKYLIVLVSACSALRTFFFFFCLGREEIKKKKKNRAKKKILYHGKFIFLLDVNGVLVLQAMLQPPPQQHCIASAI